MICRRQYRKPQATNHACSKLSVHHQTRREQGRSFCEQQVALELRYSHLRHIRLSCCCRARCDGWLNREYADQLKASRDELAAASKTEVGSAALNTSEKRALLTQKASMEKMATEARRWVFKMW